MQPSCHQCRRRRLCLFRPFLPVHRAETLKRKIQNKDSLIQLGGWAAAEFQKREEEGYSLNMPVLAIEITGDEWELWEVYTKMEEGKQERILDCRSCSFVGSTPIRDTHSVEKIFKILYYLCLCAGWGLEAYRVGLTARSYRDIRINDRAFPETIWHSHCRKRWRTGI